MEPSVSPTDFSIVIASHGHEQWAQLAEACAYCSAQQQPAGEVILYHDPTGTLAEARNHAAAQATGSWLIFLDADDELAPGYVEAMTAAAQSRALLGPAAEWVPWAATRPKYRGALGPTCDMRDANWLVIGTALERALFEEVGGFREWACYEDWDLWQRCILAGATVVEVPDAVYVSWTRGESRNRGIPMRARNEVHHEIRRANYPELY